MGRRCEREIAPNGAQRSRSRALFGWKTRRKRVGIGVSGHLPVRVTARRNEDTRQEPRPATTAVGTSRQGRVVIRRHVDSSIGRLRQLAQRLRET